MQAFIVHVTLGLPWIRTVTGRFQRWFGSYAFVVWHERPSYLAPSAKRLQGYGPIRTVFSEAYELNPEPLI